MDAIREVQPYIVMCHPSFFTCFFLDALPAPPTFSLNEPTHENWWKERRKMSVRYANLVRTRRTTISLTMPRPLDVEQPINATHTIHKEFEMSPLIGQEPQPKNFPHVILSPSSSRQEIIFLLVPFSMCCVHFVLPERQELAKGRRMGDIAKLSQRIETLCNCCGCDIATMSQKESNSDSLSLSFCSCFFARAHVPFVSSWNNFFLFCVGLRATRRYIGIYWNDFHTTAPIRCS